MAVQLYRQLALTWAAGAAADEQIESDGGRSSCRDHRAGMRERMEQSLEIAEAGEAAEA